MTPREIIAEALENALLSIPEAHSLRAADAILSALQAKGMLPKEDEVIVKREASEAMLAELGMYDDGNWLPDTETAARRIWTAMIQASEKEG